MPNRLVATRALIETSRIAIVDVSEGPSSTEFNAAVQTLGPMSVLLVASPQTPTTALSSDVRVVMRGDSRLGNSLD
jgi:hypothetical protein